MPASNTTQLTMVDLARRQDSTGTVAKIVELLNAQNAMLEDIPWYEANEMTSHLVTVRTSLPAGTFRAYNEGVSPEKSTTGQYRETLAMLEDYSKVDRALMMLNGDSSDWRASEDSAFLEGMSQTMMTTIIYGNSSINPRAFTGIFPRYNNLTGIENAEQIVDFGGTGTDNASLLLACWGEKTVHGLYPRGQIGGLQMRDLGEDTAIDALGKEYQVLRTHFKWDAGLAIEDWRYFVRGANIDVSDLALAGKAAYAGADLINGMIDMMALVPSLEAAGITPVFYANRRIWAALYKLALTKAAGGLTVKELVNGKFLVEFMGIPVRRVDAMLNTEARVV